MNIVRKLPGFVIPVFGGLLIAGCLLSGTFTVAEKFTFTAEEGIYFYDVDVTDETEWQDHKDDIDRIDLVGFELWITNHEDSPVTFSIYVDEHGQPRWTTIPDIEANGIKALADLTVAAGPGVETHISYGQSLGYIRNVNQLRDLAREGRFHAYGIAQGADTEGYTVDTARVIVTFTASPF